MTQKEKQSNHSALSSVAGKSLDEHDYTNLRQDNHYLM